MPRYTETSAQIAEAAPGWRDACASVPPGPAAHDKYDQGAYSVTDLSSLPVASHAQPTPRQSAPSSPAASGLLPEADFLDAVRLTPLVCIDLIVNDGNRRVLLGLRRNAPAIDTWFVPGGRIRKGETLDGAFRRVVHEELGIASAERSSSRLFGVFEHHYEDNFAGAPGISTHCIVLAYSITIGSSAPIGRFDQHSDYAWAPPAEMFARNDVHEHTKAYFR
jgi:colanic acid biosynthesis protein WcaH